MTLKSQKPGSQWRAFGCLGLVIVTVLGGCAVFIGAVTGGLGDASKAGDAYFRALGAGDGTTACADMTTNAQVQLTAEYRQSTCPQAVAVLLRSLSTRDRAQLGATRVSAFKGQGSMAYSTCSDNPLQWKQMVLNEEGNTWLVAQLI